MQKSIIFITLLIEVLGISIIIPAFPELKIYYGISDFEVTLGLTIYSLFAFLSAPLLGQRSDKIGRKTSLLRCIAGTSASYFLMLIQPRFWLFLLARAINGVTGGNISIIQAILTDISPDSKTKAKNFGLLGAFFGLGFIIGPVLGSLLLARGGVESIFRFGGILASLQLLMLYIGFHNTNDSQLQPAKVFQYNAFKTIYTYISRPDLKPRLLSMMAFGIGGFMLNATQGLYMFNKFGTPGTTYGYYLAIVGVISAVNMAILIPKFWTKKFNNNQLLIRCFTWAICGYIAMSFMPDEYLYIGTFYLTILMSGLRGVIYNIEIMSHAKPGEVGELSGMLGSLQSVFMIFGPLIAGLLLETSFDIHRGAAIFFLIGAGIMWKYVFK